MAEHKSAPDDGVVEQLRKYNHHLMVLHLKNNVVEGVPSVAVILYNGVQAWNPLEDLFEKYPPETSSDGSLPSGPLTWCVKWMYIVTAGLAVNSRRF